MIQFRVLLDGIKMNRDKSVTLKLETQELSPKEVGLIAELSNGDAWCGLSPVVITKLDVPEEVTEFKGDKTPSQRLRNVLFIYWRDVKLGKGDFEEFRKAYMEKVINGVKEKLP